MKSSVTVKKNEAGLLMCNVESRKYLGEQACLRDIYVYVRIHTHRVWSQRLPLGEQDLEHIFTFTVDTSVYF